MLWIMPHIIYLCGRLSVIPLGHVCPYMLVLSASIPENKKLLARILIEIPPVLGSVRS